MVAKNKLLLFRVERSLGPLESEVMEIIWKKEKVSVRDTVNLLRQKRPLAYTTVMTVMDNLYKKGFIKREKVKKSYHYFFVEKRDLIVKQSLSGVFRKLISDYGKGRILYSAIRSILPSPSIIAVNYTSRRRSIAQIVPGSYRNTLITYKSPVGLGVSFTFVIFMLGFSTYDLLQNLDFFGTFDYLSTLTVSPDFFMRHLQLFSTAILESLPVVNILTSLSSFVLFIILIKKLFKLVDFKSPRLPNAGGAF